MKLSTIVHPPSEIQIVGLAASLVDASGLGGNMRAMDIQKHTRFTSCPFTPPDPHSHSPLAD